MVLRRSVWRRSSVVLISVAIAIGTFTSEARAATTSKPTVGGSVTWALNSEPNTYDPKLGVGPNTFYPEYEGVYAMLAYISPKTLVVTPWMAQSISANATSTVWTIKIRPNLKFTDGTPYDANAVKAAWDRFKDPATGALIRSTITTWTWAVPDQLTIVVTLPSGIGGFPTYLAGSLGAIPSPTAVAKYGANYGSSPATTVGAGPFTLKEWVRNDHLILVKNPAYFRTGQPYLDQITFKTIPDAPTKADALLTKTVDIAWFPNASVDSQRAITSGLPTTQFVSYNAFDVTLNPHVAPFDDLRVRQAFTLAIDPNDSNLKAYGGVPPVAGGKGTSWYPKGSPFYDPSVTVKMNDLAAAQKLIDAYVAEKGPINVSIVAPSSQALLGTAAAQSWSRLKNVAVQVNVQTPTNTQTIYNSGNYQAGVSITPLAFSLEDIYSILHTGSSANTLKFSDTNVDSLLDEGRQYADLAHRKTYLNKIFKAVVADSIYVPVARAVYMNVYHKNIQGMSPVINYAFPDVSTVWASKK